MLKISIAVHGEGSNVELARRFVNILPRNTHLYLGGYWGIMKDIVDQAVERGLKVVLILPINPKAKPPESENIIVVDTGMDSRLRSAILVRSGNVLTCLGGEIGTLLEVFFAYAYGKPIVILEKTGMSTDNIKRGFGEYIDKRKISKLYFARTPEEAALLSIRLGYTTN